ncbi:MAG: hypothetical protein H6R29_236, partial [Methanomicrobia archaeon]|nr:hypothetical protein [Methanomicrobia archaeon]
FSTRVPQEKGEKGNSISRGIHVTVMVPVIEGWMPQWYR